jgi:hypothetical protein
VDFYLFPRLHFSKRVRVWMKEGRGLGLQLGDMGFDIQPVKQQTY